MSMYVVFRPPMSTINSDVAHEYLHVISQLRGVMCFHIAW